MRAFLAIAASCAGLLLFSAGCGGGGGPSYYIAYTLGGERSVLSIGLDEAGGIPHAEVFVDEIDMLACGEHCSDAVEPEHWIELFLDSSAVGATTASLAGNGLPDEALTVEVTRVDADGGVVEGTFTGTLITDGKFRVRRNDTVGFF
jgi:hypothetical protein